VFGRATRGSLDGLATALADAGASLTPQQASRMGLQKSETPVEGSMPVRPTTGTYETQRTTPEQPGFWGTAWQAIKKAVTLVW
jgi:hypothetical protein